ncbi:hypothetical protein DFS34DRAFT_645116 [Phlyctochytrium arcticum]|nr:hypothetical protein DFS34DRAFT_645116 [Phlyctochytrium arcticum]
MGSTRDIAYLAIAFLASVFGNAEISLMSPKATTRSIKDFPQRAHPRQSHQHPCPLQLALLHLQSGFVTVSLQLETPTRKLPEQLGRGSGAILETGLCKEIDSTCALRQGSAARTLSITIHLDLMSHLSSPLPHHQQPHHKEYSTANSGMPYLDPSRRLLHPQGHHTELHHSASYPRNAFHYEVSRSDVTSVVAVAQYIQKATALDSIIHCPHSLSPGAPKSMWNYVHLGRRYRPSYVRELLADYRRKSTKGITAHDQSLPTLGARHKHKDKRSLK